MQKTVHILPHLQSRNIAPIALPFTNQRSLLLTRAFVERVVFLANGNFSGILYIAALAPVLSREPRASFSMFLLCKTAMLFKFACYFPSQDHPDFVVVSASLDDWFAELAKAIQQELQMCGRVVARNDLRLYKVTLFFLWETTS
jgi:hypothetical protein